jgi:hypothetical protein
MAPRAILKSRLSKTGLDGTANIAESAVYLVTGNLSGIHGGAH